MLHKAIVHYINHLMVKNKRFFSFCTSCGLNKGIFQAKGNLPYIATNTPANELRHEKLFTVHVHNDREG